MTAEFRLHLPAGFVTQIGSKGRVASISLPVRPMAEAAVALLGRLADDQREQANRPLEDQRLRWLEYRPRPRPGVCLADLDPAARKAAHRLLSTGLSPHAYAQAMTIVSLEEVLDRQEGWRRGRHSEDFWVVVYGDPRQDAWAWRFEGHHLSVTMTVTGGEVYPTPWVPPAVARRSWPTRRRRTSAADPRPAPHHGSRRWGFRLTG